MTGTFVLSLDLELAWGSWRLGSIPDEVFAAGVDVARRIDAMARELCLPMTWAVVGALAGIGIDEIRGAEPGTNIAQLRPTLGPYDDELPTVDVIARTPEAWLAPALIESLAASPAGHEIASHTYLHARPATGDALVRDIEASRTASPSLREVSTLVFPMDDRRHLDRLGDAGIDAYRGTVERWYFRTHGSPRGLGRVVHTAEQAVGARPASGRVRSSSPVEVTSSAILTIRSGLRRRLPAGRIRRRFVDAVDDAVQRRSIYHLWTHPWNLALPESDALDVLTDVLLEVSAQRDRGNLQVATIRELAHGRGA